MKKSSRNISLLLLALFMYPQVQKLLHTLHHAHDKHCYVTSVVHFHATEHHCNICDEAVCKAFSNWQHFDFQLSLQYLSQYSPSIHTQYTHQLAEQLRLRGPPYSPYFL